MAPTLLPNIRRRLTDNPDAAYAPPMDNESILNAPPSGYGSGPYSPPRSTVSAPVSVPAPPAANPYAPLQADAFQKLESAYTAPHAGTLRQVLGAFVGNHNPALGGIISGETGRNRGIENAQRDYELIANAIATNRAMQTADITNRKNAADAAKLEAETGAIPAKSALENAQAEAANYKEDPNLGLIDLRTKQPVNPNALAPLSADEAQVLGKQEGERVPLKLKNTANEIVNRGYTTVNTEEGVFERKRGADPTDMARLGSNPRMMFAPGERYVPAAMDPNNPGSITYVKAKDAAAAGAGAPQSAETQAAKSTLKSATSGDIAKQSTAFQTAMQHADLLKSAVSALGNGDEQTLNSLKNKLSNEFGVTGPVTAQAIADAYQREVTSMLSKGHMTDAEVGSVGKTLNVGRQSPAQTLAVIDAYKSLAQSKMNILKQQTERGTQGKANFPEQTDNAGTTLPPGAKVRDYTNLKP
jgi:hypothetical protein